jgi:hypothetical protein
MRGIFREETLFVEGFVAALRLQGTQKFLFSDHSYPRKLAAVFTSVAKHSDFGSITTLFVKRPISGDFARFNTALLGLCNSRVQIIHRSIQISISEKLADSILGERCPFPREHMLEIAAVFQNA